MNTIRRQRGLSLLEILIALALGLVVLAGVSQVFVASTASSRTQEALALLQENGRFVVERMKPIGRIGGRFTACVTQLNVTSHLDDTDTAYFEEVYDLDQYLVAWNFNNTDVGDTLALGTLSAGSASASSWTDNDGDPVPADIAARAVAGSDIVIVKGAQPLEGLTACQANADGGRTQANPDLLLCDVDGVTPKESEIDEGQVVLVTDCTSADLFQNIDERDDSSFDKSAGGAGIEPGNKTSQNWSSLYGSMLSPPMAVYTLHQHIYYVGINAAGTPSLYEWNAAAGAIGQARELIEGVENLQLLVGEYDPADGTVDFVEPDQVTDLDFVVAIRLSVLLRQEGADQLVDTATHEVNGTIIDPTDDNRIRQVYTTTINLRNRGELL